MPVCNYCYKHFSDWNKTNAHEATCEKNHDRKVEEKINKTIPVKKITTPQIKVEKSEPIQDKKELKEDIAVVSAKDILEELENKTVKEIKEFAFLKNINLKSDDTKQIMIEKIMAVIEG